MAKKLLLVDVPDGGTLNSTIDVFFEDAPFFESAIGYEELHLPTEEEIFAESKPMRENGHKEYANGFEAGCVWYKYKLLNQ